jgi:ketosteroid isomerase-like protein
VTDPANVDLVRSIFAATERGDFSSAQWADPGVEYVLVDEFQPGTAVGAEGLAETMPTLFMDIEDFHMEAEEYRELDGERILVIITSSGCGKSSGLGVGQMYAHGANLFHVRNGKVTRLVTYADRNRALADLGLEE